MFYSFVADITCTNSRTSRISILYGCLAASYPTANFISIYLYSYGGYIGIWATSLSLGVINLLYIIFFIKDSRGRESMKLEETETFSSINPDDQEGNETVASICGCSTVALNLWECFAITFQPRNGYKRACLSILLASMCVFICQSNLLPSIWKPQTLFKIVEFAIYSSWISNISLHQRII